MATTYHSPGVYVQEVHRGAKPIEGVATAVAAFVGFTEKQPGDNEEADRDPKDPLGVRPRLITSWMQYERLYGGFIEGAYLPYAVYGFFNNGGGQAYVVRVPRGGDASADAPPVAQLPSRVNRDRISLEVRSLEPGHSIEVTVEPDEPTADEPPRTFTLKVLRDGQEVESFDALTFGTGERNVERVVNQSAVVRVAARSLPGISSADRIPEPGRYALTAAAPVPATVGPAAFQGSATERSGIEGLVIADEVTMVAVPDLVAAATQNGTFDATQFAQVQAQVIDYCTGAKDRMAILDAPPGMSAQEVKEWRENTAGHDSDYATLYYPWIKVDRPRARPGESGGDRTILVPPCGHIAGIWARNDDTRGVWKAPANEVVRGARDVDTKITKGEQDLLNPSGVNCIRSFDIRGIRVWGARTLASDPGWRYVNVRRLFNYIEETIERGTQWVVFEPNDRDLWQRVKRTLFSFLYGLWEAGALVGATPDQAFFVKCDEENNPPSEVEKGRLNVEVGLAASRPAEFVVISISQWQGTELAS